MRVAHLARVAPPEHGGIEAVIDGLSAVQARAGHDVRIVTVAPGVARSTTAGVPIVRLRRVGPRAWPLALGLGRALADVDVVHVHGIDGLLDQALAVRPPGARVGVSTHGGYLHTPRARLLKALWLRSGTRIALAQADAVWFTSEADRAALAPAGAAGRVVPDGVDLGRVAGLVRRPEPGRWLVPGRVDVHKGIDDLIDALAARPDVPWTLRVVGRPASATLVRGLRARAADRGVGDRVVVVGEVDDDVLRDELARAEVAILPSRHEGFGLALVEAMAAGVLVVARPIAAHAEHVADGEDGHLAPIDGALAPRVAAWAADPRRGAREAAARRSAARWSWEAVAPAWEAAYRELVEGR